MNRIVVIFLAGLVPLTASFLSQAAEPACTFYKVNTSLLNISKEAGGGIYIDVLEDGEVACVTKQQSSGGRDWGFISHKLEKPDGTVTVNGWSTLRYMKKISAADAKAAGGGMTAPLPVAPPAAATSPTPAKPALAAAPPAPAVSQDSLSFDQPVPFGPFPVNGNSLKELAQKIPLFPPIEGLPDELWKKNCTTCHKWNQERLCAQGKTYVKAARHVLRHQHPYGGAYKLALMKWSKSGCN